MGNEMWTGLSAPPISVGLAECKISCDPQSVLAAFGLGSCVAVTMYDGVAHVGGMLHAMLPNRNGNGDALATKYVDSGIAQLLDQMLAAGAVRSRLVIGLVGGANMLAGSPGLARVLNIGDRNVAMAHAALAAGRFTLQGQAVGGSVGRTVRLYLADGRLTVRTAGGQERDVK
jgi:chemotaxis protein CheD